MMPTPVTSERLSWRDPAGFVIRAQGRILRAVDPGQFQQTRTLIDSTWTKGLIEAGSLPRTVELSDPPQVMDHPEQWHWLEHEELSFPCYPHEITALQLYDSAQLTLRIAIEAANNGWVLKDASAWNVLHSQGRPVFVDLLSFDPMDATGTWIAYGQFVRHFILPLLLYRELGMTPPDVFLAHRDGISPSHAHRLLGRRRFFSRIGMVHVVLPNLLAPAGSRLIAAQSTHKARTFGAEVGRELVTRTLGRLERAVERLRPNRSTAPSVWRTYEEDRLHYSEADLVAKKQFVGQHLGDSAAVLDLGCNAGEYSRLAVEAGKTVVAADGDHGALSRLYVALRQTPMPIMPVLVNIGRPTPAVGWQNKEVASFLDRAAGHFDCILMLGLIHHLLVSERASLPMITDLLHRLNPKHVILEWVEPADQKFQQLAGLNHALYRHMDTPWLERHMERKFRLTAKLPLPCNTRVMYLWVRI